MYEPKAGRPVRIVANVFGKTVTTDKATDRITGIRVLGISEVQKAKNGEDYRILTFGRRTKPNYATAFGEQVALLNEVKEGDFLNLETLPTSPVFTGEDKVTGLKFSITPRMNKIMRAEKTVAAEVQVAL